MVYLDCLEVRDELQLGDGAHVQLRRVGQQLVQSEPGYLILILDVNSGTGAHV